MPALCLCSTYVHQLSTSARGFCSWFSCQHSVSCLCSLICQLFACVPAFSVLVLQHCLPALSPSYSLLCVSAPALSASSLPKGSNIVRLCISLYPLIHASSFVMSTGRVLAFSVNLTVFNQLFSRICQRSRRLYLRSNHGSLPSLRQRLHQFNSTLQPGILHQQAFLGASTSVQMLLMFFFV